MVYVLLLVATLLIQPRTHTEVDVTRLAAYLVLFLAGAIVHLASNRDKNWLRIDTVFLIGYGIVNFQWPIMVLTSGRYPESAMLSEGFSAFGMFGAWLATVFFIAWAIGHASLTRTANPDVVQEDGVQGTFRVAILTALLLVAFVATAGSEYLQGSIYTELRYDLFSTVEGVAAYIFTLLTISALVLAGTTLYSLRCTDGHGRSALRKPSLAVVVLVTGAYLATFVIAGERGQVLQIITALSIAYCSSVRPIGGILLLLYGTAAALAFSYLGIARQMGWAAGLNVISSFSGWDATLNLANSVQTLYMSIEIVETTPLKFGQLWLSNLLGVIPFAQSAFLNYTGLAPHEISGPAYLTFYVLGLSPYTGLGTSLVADLYMNAGIAGGFVLIAIYGRICAWQQKYLSAKYGFNRFVTATIFASLSFYVTRSSLLVQLQPVLWGLVLATLLVSVRPAAVTHVSASTRRWRRVPNQRIRRPLTFETQ